MIRLELELAQIDGIPVVASFASVAASGYLSAISDYIFAEPNTVIIQSEFLACCSRPKKQLATSEPN